MKALRLRLAVSLMVLLVVLAYALPNLPLFGNSPLGTLMQDRINLGLDLKGGMNLTLGVDMDKALQNTLSVTGQDVRDRANQEKITIMKPRLNAAGLLEVTLPRASQADDFEKMMAKWFPNLVQASAVPAAAGKVYSYELSPELRKLTEEMTMEQVVRTIRNRIDQFGVAEPDIRQQSGNQVQVQLPGMTDAERAIQIIGQTAHLEFRLVRDDVDPGAMMLPAGTARFPLITKGPGGTVSESLIVLDSEALMGGEDITNARPSFNEFGQAYVALEFNNRGANNFERITGENIKKRMAIVLDGKVYSAPTIQDRISGGKASITGSFTTEEAQDLAIVLRAGSLPTPVSILEERTVGPSLGKESINSGIKASLVGAAAVVIIMPLYYGISGLIADLMLAFTIMILMAGMTLFGATLTLPGIAGVVLTIGMSVDANVLIFERIREEIRNGLSAIEAVQAGFSRASVSILDSNLTTLITAAILYQFGTGPIRGFAVTLSLGILASMFTAIFVSRAIFELWMKRSATQKISV
ncbi:MAG: protein translocase subunit SecD [Mailhella sp.]|nr:protein translocase subunit SecD [Mailhella sp.]